MNQNGKKKRGIHRNVQLRAPFMAAAANWQNYLVAPAGAPVHQVSGQKHVVHIGEKTFPTSKFF